MLVLILFLLSFNAEACTKSGYLDQYLAVKNHTYPGTIKYDCNGDSCICYDELEDLTTESAERLDLAFTRDDKPVLSFNQAKKAKALKATKDKVDSVTEASNERELLIQKLLADPDTRQKLGLPAR